jgi:hypothetical protein
MTPRRWPRPTWASPSGPGTDVAIETADVVLMHSDPLDVPTALQLGRGTLRKMRQNLGWAIGYNAIALPIAAGVFEPDLGLVLRPEIAAVDVRLQPDRGRQRPHPQAAATARGATTTRATSACGRTGTAGSRGGPMTRPGQRPADGSHGLH